MIAHAPTLSIVRRSNAHRSFCAMVPFDMIAADVSPMLTPIAVTMPGQTRHNSMIGMSDMPSPRRHQLFGQPPLVFVHHEQGCRQLHVRARSALQSDHAPSHPFRTSRAACAKCRTAPCRRVRVHRVWSNFVVYESTNRVADHLLLIVPFERCLPLRGALEVASTHGRDETYARRNRGRQRCNNLVAEGTNS